MKEETLGIVAHEMKNIQRDKMDLIDKMQEFQEDIAQINTNLISFLKKYKGGEKKDNEPPGES